MNSKIKKGKIKGYLIVALFLVISTLAFGYAAFSDALDINGTAFTSGNFNVEFSNTSIASANGCSPTSTISTDKSSLSIKVPDLEAPGAYATINVTVKNTGSIAAKLLNVGMTGDMDQDVTVTYPLFQAGFVLASGETYNFNIVVAWNPKSVASNKNVNFTAILNYEQSF